MVRVSLPYVPLSLGSSGGYGVSEERSEGTSDIPTVGGGVGWGENGVNEGRPWDRVSPRLVVSSLLRFSVRHVPHVLHPRYARLRDERGTARDERRPNRVSGEDRRVTEDPARSEVTRRGKEPRNDPTDGTHDNNHHSPVLSSGYQ